VLISIYYPFSDERVLFPDRGRLVANTFSRIGETVSTEKNNKRHLFQKNLGAIVERPQNGFSGWIGENHIGAIHRSIKIQPSIPGHDKSPCRVAFKRFYFDLNHSSGYFSVGITVHPTFGQTAVETQRLAWLVDAIAKFPITSRHRGETAITLKNYAGLAGSLYATGSVRQLKKPEGQAFANPALEDDIVFGSPTIITTFVGDTADVRKEFKYASQFSFRDMVQKKITNNCFGNLVNWTGDNVFMLTLVYSDKSSLAQSRFLRAGMARLYLEVFGVERMIAVTQSEAFDRCDNEGQNIISDSLNLALRRLHGREKPPIARDRKSYAELMEIFSTLFRPGHVADLENVLARLKARPNLRATLKGSPVMASRVIIRNLNGDVVMGDKQSGGFRAGGSIITGGDAVAGDNIGGDKTGRDKITNIGQQLDAALKPVAAEIEKAQPKAKEEATKKLEELKAEAAKGKKADDEKVAGLVEGLLGLVPSAVSAVVSAFGSPILGSIAGPAASYALKKFGWKPPPKEDQSASEVEV